MTDAAALFDPVLAAAAAAPEERLARGGTHLLPPTLARLPGYVDALTRGWSPNTLRDVSAEHLSAIAADPGRFVAALLDPDRLVRGEGGDLFHQIPFRNFWIFDAPSGGAEAFCGVIMLRHRWGDDSLPEQAHGHIGYAVVPWKRGRGHATRALELILPVARGRGLKTATLDCDEENAASRRVIHANGGALAGRRPRPDGGATLVFHIDLIGG